MAFLEINDLSFRHLNGSEWVLSELDLSINKGDFCLLMGEVGSGKSTLLKCCFPTLQEPGDQEGRVLLEGKDVRDYESPELPIAFVDQDPENQIVCDTVWHELSFPLENIGLDPQEIRLRVAELAHWFGLHAWFKEPCTELSGGQKQLVNLLSVLVLRPKLLLLDEPCAQLDPVAAENLLHTLFRLNKELGMTVVLATHSPEHSLEYANRFLEIKEGQVEERSREYVLERKQKEVQKLKRTIASFRKANKPESQQFASSNTSGKDSLLSAQKLYFKHAPQDDWLLERLSLELKPRDFYALVGANGSGKSSLLFVLARAYKAQKGKLYTSPDLRQAFLPQDPKALFIHDTVDEELSEWLGTNPDQIKLKDELVQAFGLRKILHQHPYDLSGGQQQLVALAKVLSLQPNLLFLDEPSSHLDAGAKCALAKALLHAQQSGCALFMATHDLEFAQLISGSISLLFEGDIVATGSSEDFFERFLFYKPRNFMATGEGDHA